MRKEKEKERRERERDSGGDLLFNGFSFNEDFPNFLSSFAWLRSPFCFVLFFYLPANGRHTFRHQPVLLQQINGFDFGEEQLGTRC